MTDRRPTLILGILLSILLLGTIGYHFAQPDLSFFDSLYMTVITITTIGYAEVKPLTTYGRIFNLVLISLSWLGIFIVARMMGQMIVEGQIGKLLGRRKMDKKLAAISGHYIVCGYGRVGRVVCEEFSRHHQPFVLIERYSEALEEIKSKDYLYVHGDCTDDQSLILAGIARAKGLVNAVADEADAVYITLSARQQNPQLFIMARADSIPAEQKLKRAGADRVISPQVAAGTRMALAAMRPNVVDFMSIAASDKKDGLRIEEVVVSSGSRLIGKSFKEIDIRARYGLNVIGVKRTSGQIIYNPTADHVVQSGDTLIMVGGGGQLSKIDELCAAPDKVERPD